MTLVSRVSEAFGSAGPLACVTGRFQPRPGQTDMAVAVAETIEQGGTLVAEAGTGVGKTFAYLVPVLLSGERAMISTATKALQDQLFARDLPQLVKALRMPVRIALLKGRASYLCSHRLEMAYQGKGASTPELARALTSVSQWAQVTRSGDLAELGELDESSPAIPMVTSTRENCLGAECPRLHACHVNQARREAMAADIVVINHHLFFADLAVRESGVAELLPSMRVVVFDEAHQLNETGVQFLGAHTSSGQLLDFCRDLLGLGLHKARGLVDWQGLAAHCERAIQEVPIQLGRVQGVRLRWQESTPDGIDSAGWTRVMDALRLAWDAVAQGLDCVAELGPEFERMRMRAMEMRDRLIRFAGSAGEERVRWVEADGMQWRFVEVPLDIGDALAGPLPPPPIERDTALAGPAPRAWVFTSATLGDDDRLRWFTEPCGLADARVLRFSSPFDYERQAAIFVPRELPRPADPSHSTRLAQWAGDAIERLGGRTLILTTTLKALRVIAAALRARFEGADSDRAVEVLAQGQGPKRGLMERFRAGTAQGRGCVLVASASFWEGVDIPGDALQLLIIDKLPFPPPDDPLGEARAKRLEQAGRSAFKDYALPAAAVALKQGAGRLIRSETDHGVLVIGDTRLVGMGYGKRLLAALPPMRMLHTQDEFQAALDALSPLASTKASTTDLCSP